MLKLVNIKKDYVTSSETVNALRGVSISFRKKEFVSILGPSGCGKTTLLNIIGGLDHYTDGDLVIADRSTKGFGDRDWDVYRNHRIGFIFQSYNLIPHQTVLGNVELALTISGVGKEERIRRAKQALDRVGLSGQYYKRPNQLSGGQCQRVAIARALVNDPEILLADEPTGALDTVTSVQIMDLIKEISGERLVIMVTHNPELADQYSSRIVRLLDGRVVEDTNPMTEEDERAETEERLMLLGAEKERVAALSEREKKKDKREKKKRTEKAKMSFFTAFMLSARNLLSKKGRTTMVGIAGSIGIVGIALVLAFSAGIKGYIASMQDDMLSGNPIRIMETAYDFNSLTNMMNADGMVNTNKEPNRVYVSALVEYLAKMGSGKKSNTLTKEYIDYVKAMPEEYYKAMVLGYGIDLLANVYTDFKETADSEVKNISISAITSIYSSILQQTELKDYASSIPTLAPNFSQMPSNSEYILSQYDLVGEGSRLAEGAGDIMLVLNPDDELSDLLLARFGYYNEDEFIETVYKAVGEDYDEALYHNYFTYEELLGKKFTYYPNDTAFGEVKVGIPGMPGVKIPTFGHRYDSADFSDEGALELTVVGILTPKDSVSFGSMSSGIYYTGELVDYILEINQEYGEGLFEHIREIDESVSTTAALMSYYLPYEYVYSFDKDRNGTIEDSEISTVTGYVSPPVSTSDVMSSITGGSKDTAFDHKGMKDRMIRAFGGNNLANEVIIFPVSFDDKDLVTGYLDLWNEEGDITLGDITLSDEKRSDVTYTDTLELVITMVNTMIDIVSYALIAFTSVSLVVSTVMIGIITYVSVVERIKEIGIIRSLGGRKKDVSHLFNAETFIIGFLAGLIGVGSTYLISLVVNLILTPLIGYSGIAALPIPQAILLIALSVGLTLISGLIPASSAAKKDPVVALRTE